MNRNDYMLLEILGKPQSHMSAFITHGCPSWQSLPSAQATSRTTVPQHALKSTQSSCHVAYNDCQVKFLVSNIFLGQHR